MMKAKVWRADPKQDLICLCKIKVREGSMKKKDMKCVHNIRYKIKLKKHVWKKKVLVQKP